MQLQTHQIRKLLELLFSIYFSRLVEIWELVSTESGGFIIKLQYPYILILGYFGRHRYSGGHMEVHDDFVWCLLALVIFVLLTIMGNISFKLAFLKHVVGFIILTGIPLLSLRLRLTGYESIDPLLVVELAIVAAGWFYFLYRGWRKNVTGWVVATILHFSLWSGLGLFYQLLGMAAMLAWGHYVKLSDELNVRGTA